MFEQYIPNNYLRASLILLTLLFLFRVSLFLIEKVLIKLTSKTKTDVDDILVQKSSAPFTVLSFLFSFFIAFREMGLSEDVENMIEVFIHSCAVIVFAYLTYVVIDVIVIRAIKKATKKTKSDIDDSLVALFHNTLKIVLVSITILYILSLWGVEIGPLLAGLGIAGIAVALALQPILSNIFSGASVVLDRSIRVGDLVYLDEDTKGKIEEVGLRSTRIRTFDNELIIIPNNKIAEGKIQNVALPEPKSRVIIPFSVAYGSDIEKVKKVVLAELKKINHVTEEPEPYVMFLEMGESSLNFKAYFYVDTFENRFNAIDEANTRIYNALNKARISIPFPQLDVHMKKD